jgi:hypothetical protein
MADEQGQAVVSYPRFHFESVPMERIGLRVTHPQFCRHESSVLVFQVGNPPRQIALQRGARLRFLPKSLDQSPILTRCFLLLKEQDLTFPVSTQRPDGWVETEPLPRARRTVYLVSVPEEGPPLFSEPFASDSTQGNATPVELTLQPGCSLSGRLDDSVPRPVKGGQVIVKAVRCDENAKPWRVWETLARIAPDGAFRVPSLPRGCDAQFIAKCDGYVSTKPTEEELAPVSKHYSDLDLVGAYPAVAQVMSLADDENPTVIAMQPTCELTATIIDNAWQPIAGAEVALYPNQYFFGLGANVVGDCDPTAEVLFSREYISRRSERYQMHTHSDGIARFQNVPKGDLYLSVTHPRWELPVMQGAALRAVRYDVWPDRQVTVKMLPQGAQPLTGVLLGEDAD